MGHVRLGTLPRSRRWQEVVALLGTDASVPGIAAATSRAAEQSLVGAPRDVALLHSFWLLTQLPLAARSHDYLGSLAQLGIGLVSSPSLVELTGALSAELDAHVLRTGGRTDLGETAQAAAVEALAATIGRDLPELFGSTPGDVRLLLGRLAGRDRFGALARDFFSRLIRRHLDYFLSRELPEHVGEGKRLGSVSAHADFDRALEVHCRETTRIVEAFAGQWYSKANFEGGITTDKASRFLRVAFAKVAAELRKRKADG